MKPASIPSPHHRAAVLSAALFLAATPASSRAPDPPAALPETFTANVLIVNAPRAGTARLRMTVERWTTPEERQQFARTLQEGGTEALAEAMEEVTVGYLSVDNNLRWPIRVASTWETQDGRNVRIATNRPIAFSEQMRGGRSLDYPIGLIEFTLPPNGAGAGMLILAARVQFTEEGKLEVESMPQQTGPQKLTGVQVEKPRSAKPGKKQTPPQEAESDGR